MFIIVVGVNHRTAPVEIREKLSFSEGAIKEALTKLNALPAIDGCVIVSTCNRTEIYAATMELDDGLHDIWRFLSNRSGVDISEIKNYTYSHTLYDTIRHLFRVSSGLDSMILGETQILGQIKDAYELSRKQGSTNRVINTLFQQALSVGKKVRSETGIDRHAVSISYAAVELAKQSIGNLEGKSVLVIGAGKMSELTVKHLVANGVSGVIVSNRSYERAMGLARQFNGQAVNFSELYKYMTVADIVISCTAASHYVVKLDHFRLVMEKRPDQKMFIIDIAVPRDIDPTIANLPGVTLYDVDDLQNVVDSNLAERKLAAIAAEEIIEDKLDEFMKWLSTQFVIPTIIALKNKTEDIKNNELRKAFNRLNNLSEHDKKVINSLAGAIVNQILHEPVTQLKAYAVTPQGHLYTEILQNLFNLSIEGQRARSGLGIWQSDQMLATAASKSSS